MKYFYTIMFLTITFSHQANAKECGMTITELCSTTENSKIYLINASNDGLGTESDHFIFNGTGFDLKYSWAHQRIALQKGVLSYTEVNNSYIAIQTAEDSINYKAIANNTTLNNSLMWVYSEANNTVAKDKSIIMVSTAIPLDGEFFHGEPAKMTPKISNSKYYDSSEEILMGFKNNRNVFEDAISTTSSFYGYSKQSILDHGLSYDAIFNDYSTQSLEKGAEAKNTILNNNSESTVYNSAKQTGTTTVNDSAQLILTTGSEDKTATDVGAYAENVVLSGKDSKLIIDTGSAGNTAFVGAINGEGNVSLGAGEKGNYSNLIVDDVLGDNSYTFDVDVANEKGSLLTINNSSNGNHIANAHNNGAADTNGTEKITVIKDESGENAKATFESDKAIELGGYTYTVQRDSENANDWVIIGKKTENGNSIINDNAKSITGLTSSSYLLNQAELSTLRQRMGDLITDKTTSSTDISGVWGRVYGGRYKTRDNANLAKLSMNYYGFQLGGDSNTIKEGDNKNYLGAFIGHTTGKPDFYKGDSTVESWYGGLYNTFITEDNFYIDSVLKFGQYRNKYNFKDSDERDVNGKVNSNVLTLSSEIGKRFILTSNDTYNFYLEPQAQLTWSRIGSFKTGASNGLNVKQDAYNSTIGRLGALFGSQINKQSDVYLKASYLHEFKKNVKYKLNTSEESYNVQGNGVEIGIGGNVKLNENGYLYLEANYINSASHYTGSKFNVGYRYSF